MIRRPGVYRRVNRHPEVYRRVNRRPGVYRRVIRHRGVFRRVIRHRGVFRRVIHLLSRGNDRRAIRRPAAWAFLMASVRVLHRLPVWQDDREGWPRVCFRDETEVSQACPGADLQNLVSCRVDWDGRMAWDLVFPRDGRRDPAWGLDVSRASQRVCLSASSKAGARVWRGASQRVCSRLASRPVDSKVLNRALVLAWPLVWE